MFQGSGYYLMVGVVAGTTAIGRVAIGPGVYEFIGAGLVQIIGIAAMVFDVFTVIVTLGGLFFVGGSQPFITIYFFLLLPGFPVICFKLFATRAVLVPWDHR